MGTRWSDHGSGDAPRRLRGRLLERAVRRLGPAARGAIRRREADGPETARLVAAHLDPISGPGDVLAGAAVFHRVVRQPPLAGVRPVTAGEESRRCGRGARGTGGDEARPTRPSWRGACA